MAGKSQHLTLSTQEDEQLRRFEQSGHFRPKVRLWAQVIRLNAAGWSRRKIAQHTGRTYGTVCQDLKRWYERGVEGLADAPATNQPEKLTREMRELVFEKLQEERTWSCRQLVEATEQTFKVVVSAEAMRKRVRELSYCWVRTLVQHLRCSPVEAHALRALQGDRPRPGTRAPSQLGDVEKGAEDGHLRLFYLDEVGFSLALPVSYTWSRRGSKNRLRVPLRRGSHGRLNLIGALAWGKTKRTLYVKLIEESVKSAHVLAFINELARNAAGDRLSVVVLGPSGARTQRNNARFHTSTQVKKKRLLWG